MIDGLQRGVLCSAKAGGVGFNLTSMLYRVAQPQKTHLHWQVRVLLCSTNASGLEVGRY